MAFNVVAILQSLSVRELDDTKETNGNTSLRVMELDNTKETNGSSLSVMELDDTKETNGSTSLNVMELDDTKETNGSTSLNVMELDDTKETNGSLHLKPVPPDASGQGLPYAPMDWPKKGDVWTWKVGRRAAITGHFLDRYLYPPKRFQKLNQSLSRRRGLDSKLKVERFVKIVVPDADINAFFSSFSWKIPAKKHPLTITRTSSHPPPEEIPEISEYDLPSDCVTCKAGNKECDSLFTEAERTSLVPIPCDLCCAEPRFCRDCCCILCSKTIDLKYEGYSYIKCEAMVDGGICAHVSHMNCALRSYMAGTVGGSIGLDAEYYCRRCDAKTSLVPHVTKLLKTCESINSRDDIEKILKIGICILRGSEKTKARSLLNRIESAITELKCGTSLEDIWKEKESDSDISAGFFNNRNTEPEPTNHDDLLDTQPCSVSVLSISSDYESEYQKLDNEIDEVLQTLRKSQEFEYKIAEEKLYSQKTYLKNLYHQLDKERTKLSRSSPGTDADELLNGILNRVDQIKQEAVKLKEMEEIANGFGRAPKVILEQHFGLEIEE